MDKHQLLNPSPPGADPSETSGSVSGTVPADAAPVPSKRILVMASSEEASDFAALEDAMRKRFQGEGYDGVDVRNYPTPMDFIDSEDFSLAGYVGSFLGY